MTEYEHGERHTMQMKKNEQKLVEIYFSLQLVLRVIAYVCRKCNNNNNKHNNPVNGLPSRNSKVLCEVDSHRRFLDNKFTSLGQKFAKIHYL